MSVHQSGEWVLEERSLHYLGASIRLTRMEGYLVLRLMQGETIPNLNTIQAMISNIRTKMYRLSREIPIIALYRIGYIWYIPDPGDVLVSGDWRLDLYRIYYKGKLLRIPRQEVIAVRLLISEKRYCTSTEIFGELCKYYPFTQVKYLDKIGSMVIGKFIQRCRTNILPCPIKSTAGNGYLWIGE